MKVTHGRIRSTRKSWIRLLILPLCFIVLIAVIYYIGNKLENGNAPESVGDLTDRFSDEKAIEYEGKKYIYNSKLDTFLFIGVDSSDHREDVSYGSRNGGQSDFLLLLVINSEDKTVTRIQIDRDTITEITVLGVLGNPMGTARQQIAISHSYGDGKEESCQYTVEAVQRLFSGIKIDGYMAMNLNGIQTLNHLLGGVTVTLEDDFSNEDPKMVKGATLTLEDAQAELYVQMRYGIGDGTNTARMKRQKQYLNQAMDLLSRRIADDYNFVGSLFDGMNKHLTTNVTRGRIINEANKASKYLDAGSITPKGQHTIEDGFVAFYADEDALLKMVLDVFYLPQV